MTEPTDSPQAMQASAAGQAGVIDVQAHWVQDDDLSFGFECANPALQIERWDQESASRKTGFYA